MKFPKPLFAFALALLMVFASFIPSNAAHAEGTPSLSYLRVEYWGNTISIKYCINDDNYRLFWSRHTVNSSSNWVNAEENGSMNGCNNGMKTLFANVNSNEEFYIKFTARVADGADLYYGFYIRPRTTNPRLSCNMDYADTFMRVIPSNLLSYPNNSCGWWDRR